MRLSIAPLFQQGTSLASARPGSAKFMSPALRSPRVFLFLLIVAAAVTSLQSRIPDVPVLDRQGTQWQPLEWQLHGSDWSGNPFDVEATAQFVHETSQETRHTGMFYIGDGQWAFRFTAVRPGTWRVTTHSRIPGLGGHSGKVEVAPDPHGYGFVTHSGNRWARQKGVDGRLEAFAPQFVMHETPDTYFRDPQRVEQDIALFLKGHGFNGFHTPVYCRWFGLETARCGDIDSVDPNPDPRTFEALEMLIAKVHAAGGLVHLWMWGDESRSMTPARWGINGSVDERLQRYIAARLGPLPGWTIGYGFDLWEWVSGEQLTQWHDYMQQQLGWPHLLGARAGRSGPLQLSEAMDYASYEQHRPDYDSYVRALENRPGKPAFFEDRFRIRNSTRYRYKDYSMTLTRQGLWRAYMAGGVANIWGNLVPGEGENPGRKGSYPYPRPEWIKTCSRFFATRFSLDLLRDNGLIKDGYVLRSTAGDRLIFYRENASDMSIDLSGLNGPGRLIAIDTTLPYREIDHGMVQPEVQTIEFAGLSDWAVEVRVEPGSSADLD
jgi:hypothetical protein